MLTAHSLFKRLSPILLISILGGCATSTTTLQSARTLEPREIQISAAASVPVSTRAAKETFDSVEVIAGEISEAINSDQDLSSAEARQGVEAAIAYTLFTPSVYPELLFRIGIVDRFDAGLKISYSLIKPEIKFQYLDIEDGLDASIFIGYAYHFDIGPSMASHVYDIFEKFKLVDYSRHDLDFGLLFGREWKNITSLYWGARYILSIVNVDLKLEDIETIDGEAVPSLGTDERLHFAGGVVGVMVGYKYIFFNIELTLLWCVFKPKILGEEINLSGMIISPTLGLTARF